MAWKTKIPYRLIDFSARIQQSDDYVVGMKRIADSGGAGTWVRVDKNDNPVEVEDNYFANHPIYGNIKEVHFVFVDDITDTKHSNTFIRIPKFYIRSDGNSRFWIAPGPLSTSSNYDNEKEQLENDGFHCHPAFKSNAQEIDYIYIGKYQGYINPEDGHMYSIPRNIFITEIDTTTGNEYNPVLYPSVNYTFEECKKACEKWNTSSDEGAIQIQGYHMLNIHELSAVQWLSLMEIGTTNAAMPVDKGGYGIGRLYGTTLWNVEDGEASKIDDLNGNISSAANWHGILGLWGNIWEFIDGIKTNYKNELMIWDNDGRKVWKTTEITIPFKNTEREEWSPGETIGYYKNRLITAGYNYDTSDLFIPDFTTLTPYYENGSFSDGVFTKIKSNYDSMVCIGGSYATGDYGGLYSYRFDIPQYGISTNSEGITTDNSYTALDIGSRLCFGEVKIPQ